MPISAVDAANLGNEFGVWAEESKSMQAVMIPVGVAGEAAKRTEVLALFSAIIDVLWGTAPPTILP